MNPCKTEQPLVQKVYQKRKCFVESGNRISVKFVKAVVKGTFFQYNYKLCATIKQSMTVRFSGVSGEITVSGLL